jgi:hypothetical protein
MWIKQQHPLIALLFKKIISSTKERKTIVLPSISGPLGASERGAMVVVAWIQIAAENAAKGCW